MLYKSLEFLREQLGLYLKSLPPDGLPAGDKLAELENVGGLDEGTLNGKDNILITLVNLSEETALKNTPHYVKENFTTVYRNPPVYLNLFILFTACFKKYDHSLIALSKVVRFFQGKNIFTPKNSVTKVTELNDFKVIIDLYSPTFEQVNYLWSTLGGRQRPFLLYKVRLVELERESTEEVRGVIREVSLNEKTITHL